MPHRYVACESGMVIFDDVSVLSTLPGSVVMPPKKRARSPASSDDDVPLAELLRKAKARRKFSSATDDTGNAWVINPSSSDSSADSTSSQSSESTASARSSAASRVTSQQGSQADSAANASPVGSTGASRLDRQRQRAVL